MASAVLSSDPFSTPSIIFMLVFLVAFSVIGGATIAHLTQEKEKKK